VVAAASSHATHAAGLAGVRQRHGVNAALKQGAGAVPREGAWAPRVVTSSS
jgi:hypothetical protein